MAARHLTGRPEKASSKKPASGARSRGGDTPPPHFPQPNTGTGEKREACRQQRDGKGQGPEKLFGIDQKCMTQPIKAAQQLPKANAQPRETADPPVGKRATPK